MAVFRAIDWKNHHPCQETWMMQEALFAYNLTANDFDKTINSSIAASEAYLAIVYCQAHSETIFSFKAVTMNGDHQLSSEVCSFSISHITPFFFSGCLMTTVYPNAHPIHCYSMYLGSFLNCLDFKLDTCACLFHHYLHLSHLFLFKRLFGFFCCSI